LVFGLDPTNYKPTSTFYMYASLKKQT